MELMILLLGKTICRSSIAVNYLPSLPSSERIRSIKPIHIIVTQLFIVFRFIKQRKKVSRRFYGKKWGFYYSFINNSLYPI